MRRFNFNELIWFLILLGFSTYMYFLLHTGKIYMLIHPKMHNYMIFTFVGFGALAVFQFFKIFTIMRQENFRLGYLLFFITLAAGIIAPVGLSEGIAQSKGVSITGPGTASGRTDSSKGQSGLKTEDDLIIFNDENYIRLLNEIGADIEKYKGRKVSINGFVYKDDSLKKYEFVTARMVMNCCAADTQLIGILCSFEDVVGLKEEEWVRIEGVLGSTVYKDPASGTEVVLPAVKVTKLAKIKRPENPYLYQ
jgi:putative membrane protein